MSWTIKNLTKLQLADRHHAGRLSQHLHNTKYRQPQLHSPNTVCTVICCGQKTETRTNLKSQCHSLALCLIPGISSFSQHVSKLSPWLLFLSLTLTQPLPSSCLSSFLCEPVKSQPVYKTSSQCSLFIRLFSVSLFLTRQHSCVFCFVASLPHVSWILFTSPWMNMYCVWPVFVTGSGRLCPLPG